MPFLQFWRLWILLIWKVSAFRKCNDLSKSKFRASKCVKKADFALLESLKLFSCIVWVAGNFWKFPHCASKIKFSILVDESTTESVFLGGSRIITFMIYLSEVEFGGHTIFLQPGISVKPELGSALYWFNIGAQNNLDSRIRHMGCPIIYGNKWIANKWVKWIPNFKDFPCLKNERYFSFYRNHLKSNKNSMN